MIANAYKAEGYVLQLLTPPKRAGSSLSYIILFVIRYSSFLNIRNIDVAAQADDSERIQSRMVRFTALNTAEKGRFEFKLHNSVCN